MYSGGAWPGIEQQNMPLVPDGNRLQISGTASHHPGVKYHPQLQCPGIDRMPVPDNRLQMISGPESHHPGMKHCHPQLQRPGTKPMPMVPDNTLQMISGPPIQQPGINHCHPQWPGIEHDRLQMISGPTSHHLPHQRFPATSPQSRRSRRIKDRQLVQTVDEVCSNSAIVSLSWP